MPLVPESQDTAAANITHRIRSRQERLRALLEARHLPFLVVTKPANIFYLTNFRGSAGVAVFGATEQVLLVDPRYTLQARETACGVEAREEKGRLVKGAARWLVRRRAKRAGFEDFHLTEAAVRSIERDAGGKVRFVPAGAMVEELRAVKEPEEIERIGEACRLTSAVLEEVLPMLRPGTCERGLAAEIEYRMKLKGAEGAAFETIVASGSRAALPHACASGKTLSQGDLVILDLGAILGGYASDMTRTFYLGRPGRRIRQLYGAVRESQEEAVRALGDGVRTSRVDTAARKVLERRGLADYFTHSTGHGVGLEVHESPRLGRSEKARLSSGSVVTVEPGIYLEGFGGVRLEDTLEVTAHGANNLTPVSKDAWSIE